MTTELCMKFIILLFSHACWVMSWIWWENMGDCIMCDEGADKEKDDTLHWKNSAQSQLLLDKPPPPGGIIVNHLSLALVLLECVCLKSHSNVLACDSLVGSSIIICRDLPMGHSMPWNNCFPRYAQSKSCLLKISSFMQVVAIASDPEGNIRIFTMLAGISRR
jgi:hypothetical protein